jgi:hypothetical protein
MEGFSFVTPVTGLNRPNTGKEDDDDEHMLFYCICHLDHCCLMIKPPGAAHSPKTVELKDTK